MEYEYDYCLGTANPAWKRQVSAALSAAGFYSSGAASSTAELLRLLRSTQPWLVVVDTALPPGNLEQLASIIEEDGLAAALYLGKSGHQLDRYPQLPWPVEKNILTAVAKALCLEFAQKKKMRLEIETLKKKLAERRIIEKAKGLLMHRHNISEDAAFRYLRSHSMEQRISLYEAARRVLNEVR